MPKYFVVCFIILGVLLAGCSNESSYGKMPKAKVVVDDQQYATEIGTYCWSDGCVDKVSPEEQMVGEKGIAAQEGEKMRLRLTKKLEVEEAALSVTSKGVTQDVPLTAGVFKVPKKEGRYVYAYRVNFKDRGDASYVFVVNVGK